MIQFALIGCGANVNCVDKKGDTPLHLTVRGGHGLQTRFLIDSGGDVAAENAAGVTVQSLIDAQSPAFKEKMAKKMVGEI